MKKLLLLPLLVLGACSTVPPEGVDARMRQWQGYTAEALMDKWGVPAQTTKVEDQDWLIYRDSRSSHRPAVSVGVGGGSGHVFGSIGTLFGGGAKVDGCVRQVQLLNGKVAQIRWQGDPKLCWELTPSPVGATGD
ncbi:hypothetical protein PVT67_09765 [Gallaecimonas kandeliae]|uniref:hypothetical protein n=1 Tax=Gallaecimonas kandeliae TaxID=3029055 RepID=UPI0026494440|nr:hypothetical protein [Gallaecimonas kandeliae]WKE63985.1 hypothetical protein PVT67_09765 [Gallaecimonas kandeliae]